MVCDVGMPPRQAHTELLYICPVYLTPCLTVRLTVCLIVWPVVCFDCALATAVHAAKADGVCGGSPQDH